MIFDRYRKEIEQIDDCGKNSQRDKAKRYALKRSLLLIAQGFLRKAAAAASEAARHIFSRQFRTETG